MVFVVDVGNDVAQDAIPNLKHFIMSTLIVMELGKDKIRVTAVYVGLNHTIDSLLVDWKLTVLSFRFPVHFFSKADLSNQRDFFLHGSLILRIRPIKSVEYA